MYSYSYRCCNNQPLYTISSDSNSMFCPIFPCESITIAPGLRALPVGYTNICLVFTQSSIFYVGRCVPQLAHAITMSTHAGIQYVFVDDCEYAVNVRSLTKVF